MIKAGILQGHRDSLKYIKYGFNIGSNYSLLQIQKDPLKYPGPISAYNGLGFRIGLLADYAINNHFSFVPKAEMSFNETGLKVINTFGEKEIRNIYSTTVDLSPHFLFNLSRKKFKPYLLFGPGVKIPITNNSDLTWSPIRERTYCAEIGFGFNKALKYFHLAPELRYSYGINNISNMEGIKSMHFHSLIFVMNFKG